MSTSVPEDKRGERRFFHQRSLILEAVRLRTFVKWESSNVTPEDIAAAGLYCVRSMDNVKCPFCEGFIGMWSAGDEPIVEHEKHHKQCRFFSPNGYFANVPLKGSDEDLTKVYRFLLDYHDFFVSSTLPKPPNSILHTDAVRDLVVENEAYPSMNTVTARINTYTKWPKDVGIDPAVMADAGFFSTQTDGDWVKCYYCGGGLFGWLKGDSPAKDHARFYSFCPYIREKLGEEEVLKIVTENPAPKAKDRSLKLSEEEKDLLMHFPVCKRMATVGMRKDDLVNGFEYVLERDGMPHFDFNKMADEVVDFELRATKARRLAAITENTAEQHSTKEYPLQ
ncbi:hypothetical protein SK128_007085 [Halocaridina rubra]|uniref:Uncharacterized protein n=1 Tax=Halocaridina rubra TaxID=373956 RepID=A0AAN8WLX3_HALRR